MWDRTWNRPHAISLPPHPSTPTYKKYKGLRSLEYLTLPTMRFQVSWGQLKILCPGLWVALTNDSFVIQLGNKLRSLHLKLVSCKTSGLNCFLWSLQWVQSRIHEGRGHNCQQICKCVSLVMRIMEFILMSLLIRTPGGVGLFGGNEEQTLPMHFKMHRCHIKERAGFPFCLMHCRFHLGEVNTSG